MRAAASIVALAAVAPVALAGPFFTAPVSTTSCAAGQPCTITWQDDGKAPLLADYGDCLLGVYTGSAQQQSMMQAIAPANAASTGSVIFTPDPAMGENSNVYFIKMISNNAADPAMPQYKATAYSAMFTLTGMTGTFNETVKQQIAGTAASSGAPAPGAPSTSALPTTSGAPTTSTGSVSRAASTTGSTTRTTSSSVPSSSNGAGAVAVAGMGVFGATLAALFALF